MAKANARRWGLEQPFQILTLSGGGFFGLYTAFVLAELEQHIGQPIAEKFDLIAGTSVGGIIALGLAGGLPADSIRRAFEDNGQAIFSDRPTPRRRLAKLLDVLRSAFSPKYKPGQLRATVEQIVGDKTLADLERPCLVPAVNLTKGRPQVFKTAHHPHFSRDSRLKVVDVAMATSAAPTYFPVAEIGDELFIDGGLYANSPDLIALHEATYFFQVLETDVRMLSIGTTTSRFSFAHAQGTDLGLMDWASGGRLAQAMLASQQQMTHAILGHRLGTRYVRLDSEQSPEQERHLALDVATDAAKRTIRGLAEASVRDAVNNNHLNVILTQQAQPSYFYSPKLPKT